MRDFEIWFGLEALLVECLDGQFVDASMLVLDWDSI